MIEFQGWPKTPRFNRDVIVTEKIDGTNAAIIIEPGFEIPAATLRDKGITAQTHIDGEGGAMHIGVQSRKRLIVPGDDNFGFAAWVAEHAAELAVALGVGRHFGEWWGSGIQRGYGQSKGTKHFSLFNVERYAGLEVDFDGSTLTTVPELWRGPMMDFDQSSMRLRLLLDGSQAAPGFMSPEGFIIFHTAANQTFKVLLEGDDIHKGDQS